MNSKNSYSDWALWAWEHGIALFVIGVLVFLAVVAGISLHVDHRLGRVEDRLGRVPPRSYQAPNLDDYAAGDVDTDQLPRRQLVYIPVYSHVYYQGGAPYLLETTLSIRNTDPRGAIFLRSVEYFDTSGNLVKSHLDRAIRLAPLQTIEFLVERHDVTGGSGANFLVEWLGEDQVEKPLIEAVMVGTAGTQGICFSRSGVEISSSQ